MTDEFPGGWVTAPLEDIAEINPRHSKDIDDAMAVTFIPMAAISEDSPEFSFREERPFGDVRKGFTHFAEGDVLFAKITPCMENGKGAVARNLRNGLGCGTTEVHVIRPLEGIDPRYIYRFLSQWNVRRLAKENFTGTAGQLRVPTEFIKGLSFPLAPLPEQKRIVASLEDVLAKARICQERLTSISRLLRQFRQSVLAAACSGRLTADWRRQIKRAPASGDTDAESLDFLKESEWPDSSVPAEWVWVRFSSVIRELRNGVSPRPNIDPPGVPILRISAVRPGNVDLGDVRYMPDGDRFLAESSLRDGDLLFTRYNGSLEFLGVSGLVRHLGKSPLLYPDKLMRVRLDQRFALPGYAEMFFRTASAHERMIAAAKSSAGQNGISGADVKAQAIVLPSLAEQREIIRRVESLFSLADRIESRYSLAKKRIDSLSQSILVKAFRGELVTTEAELAEHENRPYESGEELLTRIHSSPARIPSQATRRGRKPKKYKG